MSHFNHQRSDPNRGMNFSIYQQVPDSSDCSMIWWVMESSVGSPLLQRRPPHPWGSCTKWQMPWDCRVTFLPIALMSMADQISPTARKSKKKSIGIGKFVRDLIKPSKSANDSARQLNSTWVSVSSASGAHSGTDAGNVELTASSKYIFGSILLLSTGIQAVILTVCTVLTPTSQI